MNFLPEKLKRLLSEQTLSTKCNTDVILDLVYRFVLSWLIVSLYYICTISTPFTDLAFLSELRLDVLFIAIFSLWIALCQIKNKRLLGVLMLVTAFSYAIMGAAHFSDFSSSVGLCVAVGIVIYCSKLDISISLPGKFPYILAGIMIIGFTMFVGINACLHYRNHWTSCFDFGIFSQMFYYMKENGLPLTTCERDELLSHFAVHFSPVFYLLLPGYYLISDPQYLLIMQPLVIASGVIPMILICKNHRFSNMACTLFSVCYMFYPCFAGGCSYYLHENCFLTPLIFWLIYFLEKQKNIPAVIFALLTLTIKEDAAIYVAVIVLYFLLTNKNYKGNGLIFVLSLVYFFVVLHFLSKYGDGLFTNRYSNFVTGENASFVSMIFTVLKNPIYFLQQCFTQDKFTFMLEMLVPLAFLPLMSKNPFRFLMLIPLFLFNLMPDWSYQYNINFQYCFGSGSLLLYMAILNYSELKNSRKLLLGAACCSVIVFMGFHFDKSRYIDSYREGTEERATIDYAIHLIPNDATVISSTWLLPNVSARDEVYELETTQNEGEYYLLDLRFESDEYNVYDYLDNPDEYETVYYKEGIVGLFRKYDYTAQ